MFKAILLTQDGGATKAEVCSLDESRLPEGDVELDVAYSALNYKDALAITGRGAVVRAWPMVPGIDLAGSVARSAHPDWKPGDHVVVTGWGLGESRWGGLAQKARLPTHTLLRMPPALDARQSMIVATAGVTAALCVLALRKHGVAPASGPVLVTGAAGGVGSVAVALLAALGFEVSASTGRPEEAAYLRQLGATHVVDRAKLAAPGKPLQSEHWAGVVDAVGSHTLANACAATRGGGAVTACGLAQGADFPASVVPFILRGVTLYGINSVYCDAPLRQAAWDLIGAHLGRATLELMAKDIALAQAIATAPQILEGKVRGRTVVDVNA